MANEFNAAAREMAKLAIEKGQTSIERLRAVGKELARAFSRSENDGIDEIFYVMEDARFVRKHLKVHDVVSEIVGRDTNYVGPSADWIEPTWFVTGTKSKSGNTTKGLYIVHSDKDSWELIERSEIEKEDGDVEYNDDQIGHAEDLYGLLTQEKKILTRK